MRGVHDEGTIGVTNRLLHYVVLLVGFSIALETAGIRLSGLFAAGAVFAVGLGFAMQTIVQNFVSGVILLIERSIRPGDVLQIEDDIVKVRRMYIRSTVVETLDDLDIIVPNSDLVQSRVRNLTYLDKRYRVRATVGAHYRSDMEQVRAVVEQAGAAVPGRLDDTPPLVLLLDFGDSSVDWEVSVWTDDPWRQRHLRSALNEQIWTSLKAANITIAFPQLDVHVVTG
ncbi:MAG TPA: mechanosensitive ion channel [Myxococcota bacterium]|nr:mechanosensitive ion channel [Myxococcota bacterium]